jgi:membrane associated rhomboid family serine protease
MLELIHYFTPAIIVCYFILSSIINANYKGFIVVIGICLTISVSLLASRFFTFPKDKQDICSLISINHISNISKIPLSIAIYTYVGCYLLYIVGTNNYILPNIMPIVIFPIIILSELSWLSSHSCFTGNQSLAAIVIGATCGLVWGAIIDTTKNKNLQYFSGSGDNTCLMPKKQTFKCKTKIQPK